MRAKVAGSERSMARIMPVCAATLHKLLNVGACLLPAPRTARIAAMANRDRLTGLDAAFLDLESGGAHMHVAGILVFAGEPPAYDDLLGAIERRLHRVPRYRQKLAFVPYGRGRPEWVDAPHFTLRYHVRHSALPAPGGDAELELIAGRLFALPLDRTKPLWEMKLVEGLAPEPDGGGPRAPPASRSPRSPPTRSSTASRASTSPRCCSTRRRGRPAAPR